MSKTKRSYLKLAVVIIAFSTLAGFAVATRQQFEAVDGSIVNEETVAAAPDPVKARAAFTDMAKVFFSARCANCHPAGDVPSQGDEMTPHSMAVTRGKDGHGVYGQRCSTCHQLENLPGEHMPPGTSKEWHMPPAKTKMVFQGLTSKQLCENLKNPRLNGGHVGAAASMEHVFKKDPLVVWAWDPGNGRTTPPLSLDQFLAKTKEWVDNGGACPE